MIDYAHPTIYRAKARLHEAILGVKRQVMAQYDPDPDAIHALGLKKRSEKKRPARQKAERPEAA
jgi:hypothetical protein